MSLVQAYTIVDRRTQQVFMLRLSRRPAVAAFRASPDALLTAHAIERRELVAGTMAETDALMATESTPGELEHHYLKAWESCENLLESCRDEGLDVLLCLSLSSVPGEAIEFSGHIMSTD
jgi:hypothetical protein